MRILPGSYLDGPGNKAEAGEGPGGSCNGIQARCNPLSHAGQGTWTFSQPLARSVQLAGVSRISARLEASAATVELVAIVYDVDRNGNATMLTRGASLTAGTGRVRFNLYPQDWRLRAGHRLGVLLAGSDDFYFAPGTSLSTVQVTGGRLRVPLLRHARPSNLNGGPSQAVLDRTTFAVAVDGRVSRLKLPRRHPLR
jgi:predicted acyl esterase